MIRRTSHLVFSVLTILVLFGTTRAFAQCPGAGSDFVASCGYDQVGQLTIDWDTTACGFPEGNISCPDCFDGGLGTNNQDSDVGALCDFQFQVFCDVGLPDECLTVGDGYENCPGATAGDEPEEGPDHVFEFTCSGTEVVTVDLFNMDCNLNLYVLSSTCSPPLGCEDASNLTAIADEQVTLNCTAAGEVHYVVVEGFGFTEKGRDTGQPDWCDPEDGASEGNYEITFECTVPVELMSFRIE